MRRFKKKKTVQLHFDYNIKKVQCGGLEGGGGDGSDDDGNDDGHVISSDHNNVGGC